MLGRDAVAVVTDGQMGGPVWRCRDGNANVTAGRRVANGGVDQDHDQLVESDSVTRDFNAAWRFQLEGVRRRHCLRGVNGLRRDYIQSHRFAMYQGPVGTFAASVGTSQQEQVVE